MISYNLTLRKYHQVINSNHPSQPKLISEDCQLDDQLEDAILEEEKYDFEPGSGEMEHDDLTIEEFSDTESYEYYYGHGQNVFSRQKCQNLHFRFIFDSVFKESLLDFWSLPTMKMTIPNAFYGFDVPYHGPYGMSQTVLHCYFEKVRIFFKILFQSFCTKVFVGYDKQS